ncbi:uncharacterized protein [Chironomus tepperi]|uniref:uncharacterized protein n=1 Tax=Chironomus tepperi TaxID=113505 RepID=UPI00391F2604
MGVYPLILLLVVLTANITNGYNLIPLKEMQALHFEEIGKLNLIQKYKAINFQINIREFIVSIQNATEHFSLVKDMFRNDSFTQNKLDNIKMVLDLKKMEFEDTLYGLVKTEENIHSRRKRETFGLLDKDDGRKINLHLEELRKKTNEIIHIGNSLRLVAHNSSTLLNNTIMEISRKSAMMYLMDQRDEIERIVNAITRMLTERRMNSEIIPITELDKEIKNIKLNSDETLPYNKLIDYYYNLCLNYTIDEDVIKVEVDIPIVEKLSRKLYKIIEIPARNEGKLIMTDVIWKYIAENDNETVVFMSLDVCHKSQHNGIVYYCKTQSPIKNKNSNDCLNNALSSKSTIDMNLCKYSAAQPTSLMFIKLNDGEYFYYTPENETLTVICGAEPKNEILVEKTSGIIELDPECIAVTSTYKLITTMRYGPTSYRKINIVRASFNVDELKENIQKYNTPFVDKFYIESMGLLRDMSKPIKSVEKLDRAGFSMDFQGYWTIIASLIIVIFVLYEAWKWKLNKQKESKKITEIVPEESVDYYIIK